MSSIRSPLSYKAKNEYTSPTHRIASLHCCPWLMTHNRSRPVLCTYNLPFTISITVHWPPLDQHLFHPLAILSSPSSCICQTHITCTTWPVASNFNSANEYKVTIRTVIVVKMPKEWILHRSMLWIIFISCYLPQAMDFKFLINKKILAIASSIVN